jgi:hypothetical protein
LRSKEEVLELIEEIKRNTERIRNNKHKWMDKNVPIDLIKENNYRIHTLEWVLGKHDR